MWNVKPFHIQINLSFALTLNPEKAEFNIVSEREHKLEIKDTSVAWYLFLSYLNKINYYVSLPAVFRVQQTAKQPKIVFCINSQVFLTVIGSCLAVQKVIYKTSI